LGVRARFGKAGEISGEDPGLGCAGEEDGPGERALAGSESDGARGLWERGADKRGPVGRGGALAWLLGDAGRPLRACWAGRARARLRQRGERGFGPSAGSEREPGPAGALGQGGKRGKGKGQVMGRTGLGFGFGLGWVLGFAFSISFSFLFLTQAQLFEFKRNFEFKPL
jgi:hypothetical protein